MRLAKFTSLAAAAALVSMSSLAQAAPAAPSRAAQSLSVVQNAPGGARAGAKLGSQSRLGSGNGLGIALLAVVVGGAIWAAIEFAKDDNPASN